MASTRAAQFADAVALGHATEWAKTLSTLFARVALFYVDGTAAQLAAAFGMQPSSAQPSLSLVAQTPLRWTLEAAAPVVGAGRAPGGSSVANHLGVSVPRSYAVLPFVVEGQLLALAYVDHADEPLPMLELSTLLREMGQPGDAPVRAPDHARSRRPRPMATRRARRNAPAQDPRDAAGREGDGTDDRASREDAESRDDRDDDRSHGRGNDRTNDRTNTGPAAEPSPRQPSGAGLQAPGAPPHPAAKDTGRPRLALAPEPEPEPTPPPEVRPAASEAAKSQAARLANAEAVARRAAEVVHKQAAEILARRDSALEPAHRAEAHADDEAWQATELASRAPDTRNRHGRTASTDGAKPAGRAGSAQGDRLRAAALQGGQADAASTQGGQADAASTQGDRARAAALQGAQADAASTPGHAAGAPSGTAGTQGIHGRTPPPAAREQHAPEAWAAHPSQSHRPGIWDEPTHGARAQALPAGIWDEPPLPRSQAPSALEQQRAAEALRLAERERAEATKLAEQQRAAGRQVAQAANGAEQQRTARLQAAEATERQSAAERQVAQAANGAERQSAARLQAAEATERQSAAEMQAARALEVAEQQRAEERLRVAEAQRLAEQQRVAETARQMAEQQLAEAALLAEQRAAEATRAAQAARAAEHRAREAAQAAERERAAHAARAAEATRAAEQERAAQAARVAERRAQEAARCAEAERAAQAEAVEIAEMERAELAEAARIVEMERAELAETARIVEMGRAEAAEAAQIAALEQMEAQAARAAALEQMEAQAARGAALERPEAPRLAAAERAKAEARRAETAQWREAELRAAELRAEELRAAERRAQQLRAEELRAVELRAAELRADAETRQWAEQERAKAASARQGMLQDAETADKAHQVPLRQEAEAADSPTTQAGRLADADRRSPNAPQGMPTVAQQHAAANGDEAAQRNAKANGGEAARQQAAAGESKTARQNAAANGGEAAQQNAAANGGQPAASQQDAAAAQEARAAQEDLARAEAELTKLQDSELARQASELPRQASELPEHQTAAAPEHQTATAPEHQTAAAPEHQTAAVPEHQTAAVPKPQAAQERGAASNDPLLSWPQVPTSPIFEYHQDTVPLLAPEPPAGHPWRNSLLIGAMALLFAAGAVLWCIRPARGPQAAAQVQVEVPTAARLPQMARMLAEEQLIRQERVFIVLARMLRVDRHLRAGIYQIPTGLWPWQVLSILHHGQVQIVRVTIPEGLTLKETANLLARQELVKAEDFMAATRDPALLKRFGIDGSDAEGFLFPETYRVVRGVSAKDMVSAMIRQFFRRLAQMPGARGLSPQALYDRVILASLVEREARARDELPRVAGVFANRLAKSMRLESCASVQYILGHPKERLQLQDVRLPSPYNTYLHPGLPPGPIANAGAAAMSAALQPEKHDFLFFLALTDGSHRHHFSRSYGEHQKFRSQPSAR